MISTITDNFGVTQNQEFVDNLEIDVTSVCPAPSDYQVHNDTVVVYFEHDLEDQFVKVGRPWNYSFPEIVY